MKRFILCAFVLGTLGQSGCGALILGGIYGGQAIHRKSVRNDVIAQMQPLNTQGEAALKAGNAQAALEHFSRAESLLIGYWIKHEPGAKLGGLAAEYTEFARTGRGLVNANEFLKNESAAAAAAELLPPMEANTVLQRLKMAHLEQEVVATAPHMYKGMRVEWEGEISMARHEPTQNIMNIVVVPFTWERRQTGFRTDRYYDHELEIYRDRIVPVFHTFKVPIPHKTFTVILKGYNSKIMPGRAASFIGMVETSDQPTVSLVDGVPTKIWMAPGANAMWILGVDLPTV